ncbi:50S ribosomal protein L19e [archaeon]|nr:50S ribosomal protein L19e [archaeon]
MNLKVQKRITKSKFGVGKKRVKLNPENIKEIKEAITKKDIKNLKKKGIIVIKPKRGISQSRTRKSKLQKRKGRGKGLGKRKGKRNARLNDKQVWMAKIRVQRNFLRELKSKEMISSKIYRDLYLKCKGGFFRSKRHIKVYLTERNLIEKKNG